MPKVTMLSLKDGGISEFPDFDDLIIEMSSLQQLHVSLTAHVVCTKEKEENITERREVFIIYVYF